MKAHKIRFYPDKDQENLLRQTCGVSRFTYNWGLAKWNELYEKKEKVNFVIIKKLFNKEKAENTDLNWLYDVTKCAPEYALKDLSEAFNKFFKKKNGYPKFKKKKFDIGSFSIANDKIWVKAKVCHIPKVGKVELAESLRFSGKIMKGTVSYFAGFWFISISVDVNVPKNDNGKAIGIDFGLKDMIVTSDGEKLNQVNTDKQIKRIIKEQKNLSRKENGSNNKYKQIVRLQKAWFKLTNKKDDWINKIIFYLCTNYQFICLENLNIKGMMKNRRLSAKFQQVSLSKLVDRLKSKADVLQVGRFFPSSQLCSCCGYRNKSLTLKDRYWRCPECSTEHDRDVNAAKNILAEAFGEFTPVDSKALALISV